MIVPASTRGGLGTPLVWACNVLAWNEAYLAFMQFVAALPPVVAQGVGARPIGLGGIGWEDDGVLLMGPMEECTVSSPVVFAVVSK